MKQILVILLLVCSCLLMAKQDVPREAAEWTRIWRNGADKSDKPHMLVIGDSISEQYGGYIFMKANPVMYVDTMASSRSIDQDYFWKQLEMVLSDEDYTVVTFNFGLHGGHLSLEDYAKGMDKYARILKDTGAKIICVSTTPLEPSKEQNKGTNDLIAQKNVIAKKICKKYGFSYCDIYSVLIDNEGLHNENDDVHFNEKGSELMGNIIGDEVVKVFNEK